MTEGIVMDLMSDALFTAFQLAAPVLIVSVLVGLVIAVLQAATQVHEQTLTFVPKLIVIGIILLLAGPWMIKLLNEFTLRLFSVIAMYA